MSEIIHHTDGADNPCVWLVERFYAKKTIPMSAYIQAEHRRREIKHALKLQELVKESTTEGNPPIIAGYLLQLIEESKK